MSRPEFDERDQQDLNKLEAEYNSKGISTATGGTGMPQAIQDPVMYCAMCEVSGENIICRVCLCCSKCESVFCEEREVSAEGESV